MTNILHLITELDIGGAERQLVALAPHFDRNRFNLSVVYLHGAAPLRVELESVGISVTKLDTRSKRDPLALLRLAGLLRDRHIAILHTHLIQADLLGFAAAKLARVPVTISTKHSLEYFARHANWLAKLDAYTNRRFTKLVAVSEAVKSRYVESQQLAPAKIEVIHNGIDIAHFEHAPSLPRETLGVDPAAKLVCTVGTLSERKGQAILLEAWPEVLRRHPSSILLFAGDGPLRASLEDTTRTLGLSHSVRFLGRRLDVPAILRAADLFVLPSQSEGFGIALVEAMAAGLPVIASNVGGVQEIIRDQHEALLVPPSNTSALAAAISALLDAPDRAAELSAAAQQRVQQFSIQTTATRLQSLYESLIARRNAPPANTQT